MRIFFKKKKGLSMVEILLATVLITIMVLAVAGAMSYTVSSSSKSNQSSYAAYLASEGVEAVRNIRDQSFTNLVDGTYGLAISGNTWTFSGTSDTTSGYIRQVVISTVDAETKRATVTVTWSGQTYTQIVDFTTWQDSAPIVGSKGMLVYGDGGTTSDTIKYKLLTLSNTWTSPLNAADVDTGSTNRALVSVKLYSSKTRNEKVMVSKHCGGTTSYFYAQVWNGSAWGNVQLLGSYGNCTNYQIEDYHGTYLRNGDFMVTYSDGTAIPKWRVWNGGYWTAQITATSLSGTPQWIELESRPGTNEVMMKTYDSANDSRTQYFNGNAYLATNWSATTAHSTTGGTQTNHYEDFVWSPVTPTNGMLIFGQTNNDTSMSGRPFTANGTGGGSWGTTVNATAVASRFENTDLTARPVTTAEYMACTKARNAPSAVRCFRATTVPAWATPTNNTISATSDGTGTQMTFDFDYETAGTEGLVVYADETTTPKLKTYVASTNTFSAAATNMTTTAGVAKSVKIDRSPSNNDIMITLGDANGDFYTQVWNGTTNALYTTPAGLNWTAHGINGYNYQSFYYDFSWDETLPVTAHLQNSYTVGTSTVASMTSTFPQPVAVGSTIVVAVDAWTGGTCTLVGGTVSDNKGNTYTYINEGNGAGNCVSVWYAYATTGGSNFTVTVTPPAARWMTIGLHEYDGIVNPSPLNGNNSNSATGTAATGGNVTTTNANNMIFGAFSHGAGTLINAAPGANFEMRVHYPDGTNEPLYTVDRFVSATGTYASSITLASSAAYGGVTVAFKRQ